jgi:O-antigen ligase
LLGLAGSLPILYVILLTQSRSGLLTLALSFIILALGAFSEFRKNIFHWKLSPLKVFALVAILMVLAFSFAESWVVLSRVGTIKTRIEYYSIALHLIARAPLLGHGLDTFALYYPQFHQLGRGEAQYIHNWPLEVWFEMGLLGLAAFGWWIASVYRVFNHALNAAQDRREESALLVLMSGVSAILLQSLFDFSNDIQPCSCCSASSWAAWRGESRGARSSPASPRVSGRAPSCDGFLSRSWPLSGWGAWRCPIMRRRSTSWAWRWRAAERIRSW